MSRKYLTAGVAVLMMALAGCGSSSKSSSRVASAGGAPPSTTAPGNTTTTGATTTAATTTGASATTPTTTSSSATTPTTTTGTQTTTTAATTQKPTATPLACMAKAGLQHSMPADISAEWLGTDPVSHHAIFVNGPYPSVSDASQSASTLTDVNHVARGGVWVVSASLRGGTGPAVDRVAACLGGAKASGKGFSF